MSIYSELISKSIPDLLSIDFIKNYENLSQEGFLLFCWKRLSFSPHLEVLLWNAINKAEEKDYTNLVYVLKDNLQDEKGVRPDLAHKKWREDFLNFLEIVPSKLSKEFKNLETISFFELLGVLLYIEAVIPFEFGMIQKLRNKYYPNASKKVKAYIDDHIVHDANNHYPRLLEAIENLPISQEEQEKIMIGIQKIHSLKKDFYLYL